MRIAKPLLTACIAALAVTLLFTWLPHSVRQHSSKPGEIAVFRTTPAVRLSNSNLVDVLVGIELSERLDKAEWSSSVLSVDMRVQAGEGRPAVWFADVEKLIRVSFVQLENVKRVLIRIVEDRPDGTALLAAVDVRKSDSWLLSDMDALAHADPVHDELWRKRMRVSFTSAWDDRFGKVSGYSAQPAFQ